MQAPKWNYILITALDSLARSRTFYTPQLEYIINALALTF